MENSSVWERPGSHSPIWLLQWFSCWSTPFMPILGLSCLVIIFQRKQVHNNSYLITLFSTGVHRGQGKMKQNTEKVWMHPQTSLLNSSLGCRETPWVCWRDAVTEQHLQQNKAQAWAAFCSCQQRWRRRWEAACWRVEEHPAPLPTLRSHAMA